MFFFFKCLDSTQTYVCICYMTGEVKLHVCYVELLGNSLADLLKPGGKKVEVMEDKFGKVQLGGCETFGFGSSSLYKIYFTCLCLQNYYVNT